QVAGTADLDQVVDESDRTERGGQNQHQQPRRGRSVAVERQTGQVGAEVARPDAGQNRDPAHRRRPALGLVTRRAVLADLVTEALPVEQPDQHRGQQNRDRQRDRDGDENVDHRVSPWLSAVSESASAPRPAALEALTSTTSPGCSSARKTARAASASATIVASSPNEPSMTAPWCMALIDLPVPTTMSRETSNRTASRPMRSCSDIASSPSSAISPSTAQLRRRWPPAPAEIHASACSPARIESGL